MYAAIADRCSCTITLGQGATRGVENSKGEASLGTPLHILYQFLKIAFFYNSYALTIFD
jgi:hypothetical protein